jgi:hypothetical protein
MVILCKRQKGVGVHGNADNLLGAEYNRDSEQQWVEGVLMGRGNKKAREIIEDFIQHLPSGSKFHSSCLMKQTNCPAHTIGMLIKSYDDVDHVRIGRHTMWIKI